MPDDDRDSRDDGDLQERVDRAMTPYRGLLTEEEWQEQRRMLLFLAKTHPRFSDWIERQRPPAAPDQSGFQVKKDATALEAALQKAEGKTRRGRAS